MNERAALGVGRRPSLRILWWEGSDLLHEVFAGCRVCGITDGDVVENPIDYVVSPSGIAHHANEYGDTGCGKDATRDGWWWPL